MSFCGLLITSSFEGHFSCNLSLDKDIDTLI